jgi:hypothetical protein
MKNNLLRTITSAAACLWLSIACAAQKHYTVKDLGVIDGYSTSTGLATNAAGTTVGYVYGTGPSLPGNTRAFIKADGSAMADLLPDFASGTTTAVAINDSGVVGGTLQPLLAPGQAFRLTSQALETFPMGDSSTVSGMNPAGDCVGYFTAGSSVSRAFVWRADGSVTEIPVLPGGPTGISATSINKFGAIVGASSTSSGLSTAFIWTQSGGTKLLLPKESRPVGALSVNDNGFVAGFLVVNQGAHQFLVVDATGREHTYSLSSKAPGDAYSINNANDAVGSSNSRAVIATAGKLFDLNSLIPANTGWLLRAAYSINDSGVITGTGAVNGLDHAFVLTPIQ